MKILDDMLEIIMFDGSIKHIKDLQKDEFVLGRDGDKKLVKTITKQNNKEKLYLVIPRVGFNFCVSDTTTIKCFNKITNKEEYISPKDFEKISQYEKQNLSLLHEIPIFCKNDIFVDPYMMGIILLVGTIKENEDVLIIPKMKQKIQAFLMIWLIRYKITHFYKDNFLCLTDQKILKLIMKFDRKRIPYEYKINIPQVRLLFLASFIDILGQINVYKNCFDVRHENEMLIDDIIFLCNSLGLQTIKRRKERLLYIIEIYGSSLALIPLKCTDERTIFSHDIVYDFKIAEIHSEHEQCFVEIEEDNIFLPDFTLI